MNISQFIEERHNLRPEVVQKKYIAILSEYINIISNMEPEEVEEHLGDDDIDIIENLEFLEKLDFFGTEGVQV